MNTCSEYGHRVQCTATAANAYISVDDKKSNDDKKNRLPLELNLRLSGKIRHNKLRKIRLQDSSINFKKGVNTRMKILRSNRKKRVSHVVRRINHHLRHYTKRISRQMLPISLDGYQNKDKTTKDSEPGYLKPEKPDLSLQ